MKSFHFYLISLIIIGNLKNIKTFFFKKLENSYKMWYKVMYILYVSVFFLLGGKIKNDKKGICKIIV
ncbi:hypothetical protein RN92_07945 [Fusobacterium hwasookii ChDC F206]|uniref:Uncharacterized protein n=1 Tax=Fusobacterium hwasookii ChDC F206 TaxID=1307443 RepID=A0AAC8WK95_9FUSO|nr:hypothetical protein RN92_07945 [Fusobacterium hwasookii ChDC F206]ALQ37530.1 hypothetical protein RN97_04755 [Fusobacterium hwasookii ChDC F300]